MDASKSFAKDSDIEDLVSGKIKCGGYDTSVDPKFPEFLVNYKSNPTEFQSSNLKWIRPLNLTEVFAALESNPGNFPFFLRSLMGILARGLLISPFETGARLVVANTSVGIYKKNSATVFIDIDNIPELLQVSVSDSEIVIGAAITISKLLSVLKKLQSEAPENSNKVFLDPHSPSLLSFPLFSLPSFPLSAISLRNIDLSQFLSPAFLFSVENTEKIFSRKIEKFARCFCYTRRKSR